MTLIAEPPAFALDWCNRLGASLDTLEQIKGGINGQVFRCKSGANWFVIKSHDTGSTEKHNRFKAETEFLTYAQIVAPGFVPQLLYYDELSLSLVLEHLNGDRFQEGTHPRKQDIKNAVEFMRRINSDLDLAKELVRREAAEGFLKLTEHLRNIEQRIEAMTSDHLPISLKTRGEELIKSLNEQFEYVNGITTRLITQGQCQDALSLDLKLLSPSDFGFHNAIKTKNGTYFFDFEFAGWDDPAKTIVDFTLHPRNSIKTQGFVLATALPSAMRTTVLKRSKQMLPILHLKWACIIASVLSQKWTESFNKRNQGAELYDLTQKRLLLAHLYVETLVKYENPS